METGTATAFALDNLQERGILFVKPTEEVYEGMIIGENSREDDMDVNPCKEKKLTNMRASGTDEMVKLEPPRAMELETCMEWIMPDELIEVTPLSIRFRKKILRASLRNNIVKYKMVVAYDGTNYHGWQLQNDQPTVAGVLSNQFHKIFDKSNLGWFITYRCWRACFGSSCFV